MTAVRRATRDDARAIADVKIETWRATYVGIVPQQILDALDIDEHERIWWRVADTEGTAVFVAEDGGTIVGFASVGPCRTEASSGELYAIYVRPSSWGSGAGQALMDAAVAWLGERWTEAVLWVAEANPRARRFYERCGWVPDGARVDEVMPGAHVPEVLYRLRTSRP
jgi:RimJ/RimL family protein N-acetyltransferase